MVDARLLELIEAEAWADIFRAAPPALAEEHGIAVLDLGAGAACIVARDVPSLMLNRVIGLGVGAPATPAMLDLAGEAFGEARYMIPVAPQCHPAELTAWLRGRGFEAGYPWMKFERGPEPPPDVESALDVRPAGTGDADEFARALIAGYEMPRLDGGLGGGAGRDGRGGAATWRCTDLKRLRPGAPTPARRPHGSGSRAQSPSFVAAARRAPSWPRASARRSRPAARRSEPRRASG